METLAVAVSWIVEHLWYLGKAWGIDTTCPSSDDILNSLPGYKSGADNGKG